MGKLSRGGLIVAYGVLPVMIVILNRLLTYMEGVIRERAQGPLVGIVVLDFSSE